MNITYIIKENQCFMLNICYLKYNINAIEYLKA